MRATHHMAATGVQSELIDARPIRAIAADTDWDRAVSLRDHIGATVRSILQRERLEALVIVSANGNYPPWVRLEAWLPAKSTTPNDGAERERAELTFIVDVKGYHEHKAVVTAKLTRGKRSLAVENRPHFSNKDIGEWALYALGRETKPSNYTPVTDALQALLHAFLRIVPEPHRNRVAKEYRKSIWQNGATLAFLACFIGIVIGFFKDRYEPPILAGVLIPLGVVALVAAAIVAVGRKNVVSVMDQSVVAPRNLGLVDSWHAVVAQIGRDSDNVRHRLVSSIAKAASMGVQCQAEVYGYRTPNGYEERERLVVSKGQGHVHVHMYPFGEDMFIGWQAFLNWAQWTETAPISKRVVDRQEIEFRDLRTGSYIPNQFDLMDLNSLSELVHRRIERELKAILREKAIDQQIDFKIIRGDRDRALDKERHKEGGYS